MKGRMKLNLRINKKNGQISSWFRKKQLPAYIRKAIKEQPNSVKKMIVKFEGWE